MIAKSIHRGQEYISSFDLVFAQFESIQESQNAFLKARNLNTAQFEFPEEDAVIFTAVQSFFPQAVTWWLKLNVGQINGFVIPNI